MFTPEGIITILALIFVLAVFLFALGFDLAGGICMTVIIIAALVIVWNGTLRDDWQ